MALADRIVLLQGGKIAQDGSPTALYNDPTTLFAAEFMGSNNRLEGRLVEKANGHATMDVFGERITGMARTQASVGEAAVGIIRLERMRCMREPGPNRLPMQLETPMYLGERWELLFARGDTTVRAYADEPLPPGQHYVEFPADALWVF